MRLLAISRQAVVKKTILMPLSVIDVFRLKPYQYRIMNWNKIQLSTYLNRIQKYLLILKFEVDKMDGLRLKEI